MNRIIHKNQVITYTFDSLATLPVESHISTRHGGVSPAPWNTLNFSVLRGDERERVQENRLRLATALGIDRAKIINAKQIHGTGVAKVSSDEAGQIIDGCDALICNEINLPLQLVFADCTPILLFDPAHQALGICHAGWRGTINGAAAATLWAMQAAYDTNPLDVIVCIGPSIGPESYEVGEEVLSLAYAKIPYADKLFTYPNGNEARPYFNLWRANLLQLKEAGVPEAQIELSNIDTAKNTDDFFSHRAEKGRCGLFSMTAWLTGE